MEAALEPLLQLYDKAPEAESVAVDPAHTVLFEIVTVVLPKLGLKIFAFEHPFEPVPLTEKEANAPAVIDATAPPLIE